jgi:TetR/AcrR family transcriptional regulator, cholesterol catabolism regulator
MSERSGLRGHRVQNVERAESRRREILIAAARVFARQGYDTATLDDVALSLGVTKGVIYYYFPSKEALLTEIRTTAIGEAIQRLETIVAAGGTPQQQLERAVNDLVGHIFDDLERYANVLHTGQGISAESRERVRTLQRRFEQIVQGIIEAGIASGSFLPHDPKVMTFTVLRAALGVASWYAPDGLLQPELIAHQVTRQIVGGVLVPGTETAGG